jgi:hypothetical protein
MQLDAEFTKQVKCAVHCTWEQIAFDCQDFVEDNVQAVEMCIDADRLLFNGQDATAHALVKQACREHSYVAVLKFLSSKITLM